MSPRQPVVSGKALVRALERDGWSVARQRGSHVRLKKPGRQHALVVPLHREIRKGTLAGILRDAGLSTDRLRELLCLAPRDMNSLFLFAQGISLVVDRRELRSHGKGAPLALRSERTLFERKFVD